MPNAGTAHAILIVDDEERLRKALSKSFRQEGYATCTAASGEEALAAIQERNVDLVITDLIMPGMDGIALVGAIRRSRPAMKMIVLTAYGSEESMAEARTLGVADYLAKPFDLFQLKSSVRRLLGVPRNMARAQEERGVPAPDAASSAVGGRVGAAATFPARALARVQPERLWFAAGRAAGWVSGLFLCMWRRFAEAR